MATVRESFLIFSLSPVITGDSAADAGLYLVKL